MTEEQQSAAQTPTPTATNHVTVTTTETQTPESKPQGGLEGSGQVATPVSPEAKPTETTPPEVPKDYELTLSEGSLIEPQTLDELKTFAKSNNLTETQAKGILAREEATRKALVEQAKAHRESQINSWIEDSKKDQEFGGEKLGANLEIAKRAMNRFAGDKLNQILNESGMGNHPEVIRLFYKIGKASAEGQVVGGGSAQGPEDRLRKFYGKSMKE